MDRMFLPAFRPTNDQAQELSFDSFFAQQEAVAVPVLQLEACRLDTS